MTVPSLRPPTGGDDAPRYSSQLPDGQVLDLEALAGVICRQYRAEFPDERMRYGAAGNAWCVHDNQHLLNWAVESVNGGFDIKQEVAWLVNVLVGRNFPIDRLARTLDIGAEVVLSQLPPGPSLDLAGVLTDTAAFVRSGAFQDYDPNEG
jgi:hypothetical protein